MLASPVTTCVKKLAVELPVAGNVFDGVLIYAVLFPMRCLE